MSDALFPQIEVQNVRRVFRSVKKEEGLKGSLKLLFKPEVQETEAVKGVSFRVEEPGAFIGLIGANGAGKTTLLKMLTGLIPPSSGQVRVLGIEPFKRPIEFRKQIALVMGQKAQLWWDLPAKDAFDLNRAIYEIPRGLYAERLETLSELLDVKRLLSTQIRRLSLGERMKMELIGAILHWPKVIFLDEPTIGLDILAAQKLREFLKTHNEREKALIILTSHNMDDIEKCCSRVLIMREGQMIFDGNPQGLTRSGLRRVRVRLKERPENSEVAALLGLEPTQVTVNADEDELEGFQFFEVPQDQAMPSLQKLMTKYEILDVGFEEQSLESVIQRIYETPRGESVAHHL